MHRKTSRTLLGLWLTSALFLIMMSAAGCGAGNPFPKGSYERAEFFVEHGKNVEAVSALETFVRHNPTDSLAAQAQYMKGMTYMDMKEYPLAVVEFQILGKDYPTSPLVEEAMFQEGMAYYKQVGRVERDVTGGHEARLHFLKFGQKYPQSAHMDEVISTMQDISDLMVRKRLQQAKVFRQLHRPKAAVVVLGEVLKHETNSRLLDEVLWQRGQAAAKAEDFDLARDMYGRLIRDYPESEFADRAEKALKDLTEVSSAEEG